MTAIDHTTEPAPGAPPVKLTAYFDSGRPPITVEADQVVVDMSCAKLSLGVAFVGVFAANGLLAIIRQDHLLTAPPVRPWVAVHLADSPDDITLDADELDPDAVDGWVKVSSQGTAVAFLRIRELRAVIQHDAPAGPAE